MMCTQVWFVSNHILLDSGVPEDGSTLVMVNGEKVIITRKDRREHAQALQGAEACFCVNAYQFNVL